MFNKKNYYVSLTENTPIGTPLPIDINVHDPDMVSICALRQTHKLYDQID